MAGRLAPSGQQFLPELSRIAELTVAAAGMLRDGLVSGTPGPDYAADLAAQVREAKQLAEIVAAHATSALVPPIDGEDAAEVAARLRDIVDAACRVSGLADAIRPDLPDARVAHLANLLVQAADSLEGAVVTLTDRSSAVDFADDVRQLSREGDRAYGEAMAALLATAPDPVGAVRQAEIYRALCESLRACTRAAAVVGRIALKRF